MSATLTIRVRVPLKTRSLLEDTQKILGEILTHRQFFSVKAKTWGEGTTTSCPPFIWLKSGLVIVSIDGNHPIILMIINLSDDDSLGDGSDAEIYADVEAKGTGGNPAKMVTAAACAIAIAQQSNSFIEDESLAWGKHLQYEPNQLLEQLRCREQHDQIDEAIAEVLRNIEKAKVPTST